LVKGYKHSVRMAKFQKSMYNMTVVNNNIFYSCKSLSKKVFSPQVSMQSNTYINYLNLVIPHVTIF
jgi:hypothetical protein